MRVVTGLLAPFQLDLARRALGAAGAQGLTLTQVSTAGAGLPEVYRGAMAGNRLAPRLRVEVLAADEDVTAVVKALTVAARSGAGPQGPVWVSRVVDVARIRTGETGTAAL